MTKGMTTSALRGAAGFWTIRFKGEEMETRVKTLPTGVPTTRGRELNTKIRSLHRGMSIGAVEAALGEPRDHQVEIGGDEIESLWYGASGAGVH